MQSVEVHLNLSLQIPPPEDTTLTCLKDNEKKYDRVPKACQGYIEAQRNLPETLICVRYWKLGVTEAAIV